jgi:hypothetical protein
MDYKCSICGENGKFSQSPYPVPFSDVYCDTCYELEEIAFNVWCDLFPETSLMNMPIPFTRTKQDLPPNYLEMTLEQVQEFYRRKLAAT